MPPECSEPIDAGDLRLMTHRWGGPDDGTPVLLAHPTGFHGVVWEPVALALVEAGYRPFSFDFRGHGDSDRSPDGYHWDGFAGDVLAVTRHLGLAGDPRLVAAGHSKGAAALLLAEAAHPGTYARLWCYEPITFPVDEPLPPDFDNPLTKGARRRRDVWESELEAERSYASKPPLDTLDPRALHAYVTYGLRRRDDGKYELKCRPDDEAEIYAMAPANGMFARLRHVRAPVLVACGENSDAIPPKLAVRLVERLPHGRLDIFSRLGHFGPMEAPERIAASIAEFEDVTR